MELIDDEINISTTERTVTPQLVEAEVGLIANEINISTTERIEKTFSKNSNLLGKLLNFTKTS